MVTNWQQFDAELKRYALKLQTQNRQIFDGVVDAVADSIINGSELTGSPGQPHDLREGQWVTVRNQDAAVIATADPSARSVEDGISHKHGTPLTRLKSDIGGFHSVALTRLGFEAIVDTVARRVTGA